MSFIGEFSFTLVTVDSAFTVRHRLLPGSGDGSLSVPALLSLHQSRLLCNCWFYGFLFLVSIALIFLFSLFIMLATDLLDFEIFCYTDKVIDPVFINLSFSKVHELEDCLQLCLFDSSQVEQRVGVG